MILLRLCIVLLCLIAPAARAGVVISEVHWMGSDISTADEWLELAYVQDAQSGAVSEGPVSLAGWSILSRKSNGQDGEIIRFATGTTLAQGEYLLVANYGAAQSRLAIDAAVITTGMSLPNTKLLLTLLDDQGATQDTVDDGVGVPFAGANPSGTGAKASMERIDLLQPGTLQSNWRTATTSINFDAEYAIFGTPGASVVPVITSPIVPEDEPSTGTAAVLPVPEVTNATGSILSGSFILSWQPPAGIVSITVTTSPLLGTGVLELPPFATGVVLAVGPEVPSVQVHIATYAQATSSSGVMFIVNGFDYENTETGSVVIPDEDVPSIGTGAEVTPPAVVISEVLPNPIGSDDEEWIEIVHAGTGSVNLEGWSLENGFNKGSFKIKNCVHSGGIIDENCLLHPGEYRVLSKTESRIILGNEGGEIILRTSGGLVVDRLSYPALPEGIGYGRMSGAITPLCSPTQGLENATSDPDVRIDLQSGAFEGVGKATVNLQASIASGSLAGASCHWLFGDGWESASCNPPSHTITGSGRYSVVLTYMSFCGTTITRSAEIVVHPSIGAVSSSKKKSTPMATPACTLSTWTGIEISEFIPNPFEDEEAGEWIELKNTTDATLQLCGWSIDDEEGGSRPYELNAESIPPLGYLLLPREQTSIALNNDRDEVRLLSSGNVFDHVSYERAPEGESLALRSDGHHVWTPYPSPEKENKFRTAERRFPTDRIIVSAALPNPQGKDDGAEWIELMNVNDEAVGLDGWMLAAKPGTSKLFALSGVRIEPGEVRRFGVIETGIALTNTDDSARLLDPDGYVVSLLSWKGAVEGKIYRPPVLQTEMIKARVVRVVDGDTVDIALTDVEQLARIPTSLKYRWMSAMESGQPWIRVRMIGIDTPETVHPSIPVQRFGKEASAFTKSILEGKEISIQLEEEAWDKYDRLLGYIFLDGIPFQPLLLRKGLAYTYKRFPFAKEAEYIAYESEARSAKLGIWSDSEAVAIIEMQKDAVEQEVIIEQIGLRIESNMKSNTVDSGSVLIISKNIESKLYASINSGAVVSFSGSYRIGGDVHLVIHAERASESGEVLRSNTLDLSFVLKRDSYPKLVISEVYPSPLTGTGNGLLGEEWIEIWNPNDEVVPLAGWKVDDIRNGGSKIWELPFDININPNTYFVLSLSGSGLALNNDGDDIWLLSPNDDAYGLSFPSVKKGRAFGLGLPPSSPGIYGGQEGLGSGSIAMSLQTGSGSMCMTDVPTPGEENICILFASGKTTVDSDRDFLPDDREEWMFKTDLLNPDTDGDKWLDGFEVKQGMDPLTKEDGTIETENAYRAFVLEELSPKWYRYVRKGLTIKGKSYPLTSLSVGIGGDTFFSVFAEDGSWEVIIDVPLSAGIHTVDIQLVDVVGRLVTMQGAFEIELTEDYPGLVSKVSSAKKSAASSTQKTKFKYKNIVQENMTMGNDDLSLMEGLNMNSENMESAGNTPLKSVDSILVTLATLGGAAAWVVRRAAIG